MTTGVSPALLEQRQQLRELEEHIYEDLADLRYDLWQAWMQLFGPRIFQLDESLFIRLVSARVSHEPNTTFAAVAKDCGFVVIVKPEGS